MAVLGYLTKLKRALGPAFGINLVCIGISNPPPSQRHHPLFLAKPPPPPPLNRQTFQAPRPLKLEFFSEPPKY